MIYRQNIENIYIYMINRQQVERQMIDPWIIGRDKQIVDRQKVTIDIIERNRLYIVIK